MEEGEPQHAYAGRRGPDGPLPQAALGPKLGDPRRSRDLQPSDRSSEIGTEQLVFVEVSWWGCCWPAFGDLWGAREFTPFLRAEQNCTSAIDPLWVFAFGKVNRRMWPLGEEKDL